MSKEKNGKKLSYPMHNNERKMHASLKKGSSSQLGDGLDLAVDGTEGKPLALYPHA